MIKCLSQLGNKKGAGVLAEGEVVFILLNIIFFFMLLWFVNNECRGTDMKEKILAKEVSMFINSAEPGTLLLVNIKEYKDIAEGNKITNFIRLQDGKVVVSLSGSEFSYPYFSDYSVEGNVNGDYFAVSIK